MVTIGYTQDKVTGFIYLTIAECMSIPFIRNAKNMITLFKFFASHDFVTRVIYMYMYTCL